MSKATRKDSKGSSSCHQVVQQSGHCNHMGLVMNWSPNASAVCLCRPESPLSGRLTGVDRRGQGVQTGGEGNSPASHRLLNALKPIRVTSSSQKDAQSRWPTGAGRFICSLGTRRCFPCPKSLV